MLNLSVLKRNAQGKNKQVENFREVTSNFNTPLLLILTVRQKVNIHFLYLRQRLRKISHQ